VHRVVHVRASILTALVLAVPGAAQETKTWDPWVGMDRDGRIERPEIPDDLPNPERWRYTPAGRIAPGNVFDRFLVSTFFSPLVFFRGDVGTGGGFALTDIDFRNQDYQEFANILVSYTTEGQQAYSFRWKRWLAHRKLADGGILREERSTLNGQVTYTRTLTRRFFGLGSRTSPEDETSYTEALAQVGLGTLRSFPDPGDDLLLEAGVRVQQHRLAEGHVTGVASTEQVFGDLVEEGDGLDQLWLDLGLAHDSRDSLHQPYRGWRLGLSSSTALLQTGGQVGSLVALDSQVVLPLPPIFHDGGDDAEENPPTDVLALGGFVVDTLGDLPFYALPSLGGTRTLRGYVPGRFTDRSAVHLSAEYRLALMARGVGVTETIHIERIGLAFFYDAGTVADELASLGDARWLDSVGLGLRIGFSREASFRIDLGRSDEDTNLTITYGNAF
jgi:hypothetical protein